MNSSVKMDDANVINCKGRFFILSNSIFFPYKCHSLCIHKLKMWHCSKWKNLFSLSTANYETFWLSSWTVKHIPIWKGLSVSYCYVQGPRNRWSTCFTGIQRFYYREIFSILNIWRGKFFVLHQKKACSGAPGYVEENTLGNIFFQ